MKTKTNKTQNQNSGLLSRPEQSSTDSRPKINFAVRNANRSRDTESLLQLLRNQAPEFYQLAEVVGKWVWIQFKDKQPCSVTAELAEFGFHWNNTRQTWQHPCGLRRDQKAPYDPRKRYRSYFAADVDRAF